MTTLPRHKAPGLISIIAYMTVVGLVLLAVWLAPLPQAPVAVLIMPGSKPAFRVVEAAGGHMISISNLPNIVIAQSDHPGFIAKLYTHGALFVFNPQYLTGCQTKV